MNDIQYTPYMPFLLKPGDTVTIGPNGWRCTFECTLIGATIENDIPVLQVDMGRVLNKGELVLESEKPTNEPGNIEEMILSQYQKVNLPDLPGKTIKYATTYTDDIIIITEDSCYVKLVASHDPESYFQWDSEDLSISDLRTACLLSDEQWNTVLAERETLQQQWRSHQNEKSLRKLVGTLGRDCVKKILGLT